MVARDGLRVAVRLSPGAKADCLVAIMAQPGGRRVLRAAVAAPAESGRAKEALLRLLARAWHLPRRDLSVAAGATSRSKSVRVAGDPQRLVERIMPTIAGLPGW